MRISNEKSYLVIHSTRFGVFKVLIHQTALNQTSIPFYSMSGLVIFFLL
jgi:hypothetical protein